MLNARLCVCMGGCIHSCLCVWCLYAYVFACVCMRGLHACMLICVWCLHACVLGQYIHVCLCVYEGVHTCILVCVWCLHVCVCICVYEGGTFVHMG